MWLCVCRCQWRCEWQYRHLSQNSLKTSCFPVGCWHVHRILPNTRLISAFPTHPNWKMLNLVLIHKLQPEYAANTTCIKVEIQSFGTIVAPVLCWRFSTMAVVYFPSRYTCRLDNSCVLRHLWLLIPPPPESLALRRSVACALRTGRKKKSFLTNSEAPLLQVIKFPTWKKDTPINGGDTTLGPLPTPVIVIGHWWEVCVYHVLSNWVWNDIMCIWNKSKVFLELTIIIYSGKRITAPVFRCTRHVFTRGNSHPPPKTPTHSKKLALWEAYRAEELQVTRNRRSWRWSWFLPYSLALGMFFSVVHILNVHWPVASLRLSVVMWP